MARDRRITVLKGLGLLLLGALVYAYGYVSFRFGLFPARPMERIVERARGGLAPGRAPGPPGRWRPARERVPRAPGGLDEEAQGEAFGLPYAAGTRPAASRQGVTILRRDLAAPGYNLVVSGHSAAAVLIDMEGRTIHSWTGSGQENQEGRRSAPYWRRARLVENGDLIAIHEGGRLLRLDAASRTVWTHDCECHHDLEVDPEGNVLVLDRREAQLGHINPDAPVLVDWVVVLSPAGEVVEEFSVLEAFERSEFSRLLDGMAGRGDLFHTNTIALVGENSPRGPEGPIFSSDDILVSLRHLDIIAVISRADRRVIWAITGLFRRQHDPVLLPGGTLLLFDNLAGPGRSRVIEFDPTTLRIVWSYEGTAEAPFYSETCGTSQRLSNGNTLITESDEGRAFEVTPDGRIVWEFLSPYRAGDEGELVATLFEITRLPPGFPVASFTGASPPG